LKLPSFCIIIFLSEIIVEKVIDSVKAKITLNKVFDVAGALKGLFGKK